VVGDKGVGVGAGKCGGLNTQQWPECLLDFFCSLLLDFERKKEKKTKRISE